MFARALCFGRAATYRYSRGLLRFALKALGQKIRSKARSDAHAVKGEGPESCASVAAGPRLSDVSLTLAAGPCESVRRHARLGLRSSLSEGFAAVEELNQILFLEVLGFVFLEVLGFVGLMTFSSSPLMISICCRVLGSLFKSPWTVMRPWRHTAVAVGALAWFCASQASMMLFKLSLPSELAPITTCEGSDPTTFQSPSAPATATNLDSFLATKAEDGLGLEGGVDQVPVCTRPPARHGNKPCIQRRPALCLDWVQGVLAKGSRVEVF